MHLKVWSTEEIYHQLLSRVAPLPSQQQYARDLCAMMAQHINRNTLIEMGMSIYDLPSQSALILGRTGTGKTFLLRKLCEMLGLGYLAVDCSALSREGWKGESLSQKILAAKDAMDEQHFRYCVLFLDEIDKMVRDSTQDGDPTPNLLQLANGTSLTLHPDKAESPITVPVDRWLILYAGSFAGIESIVEKRLVPAKGIGFGSNQTRPHWSKAELLQQVTHADLLQFGVMEELLGRISCVLQIPAPALADYRQLLSLHKGTLLYQYQRYLAYVYGVGLAIDETAVQHIADCCTRAGTGIRAVAPHIHSAMHSALQQVEQDKTISKVVLEGDNVRYEHGKRNSAVVFFRDTVRVRKIKVITSTSAQRLASILCTGYRRAGGNMHHVAELHAFLTCTIYYLFRCLPNGQCDMASLAKLANTLKEAPKGGRSTYDIMFIDASNKPDEHASTFVKILWEIYYAQPQAHPAAYPGSDPANLGPPAKRVRCFGCSTGFGGSQK